MNKKLRDGMGMKKPKKPKKPKVMGSQKKLPY
jgi:hypothetical protein